MIHNQEILERLKKGNEQYISAKSNPGDISAAIRKDTAENGQHPYAVVVTCSDSRVIPESIFSAGMGELFVVRVAGNVLGDHELGCVEYGASHLGSKVVVVLGHTNCGAVGAAMEGGAHGFIKFLTDEITAAIGDEKDYRKACCLNATHGVDVIKEKLHLSEDTDVVAALYDITDGHVEWL